MIEKSFHDISYEETEKLLNTSITNGLKSEEIETRRTKYGANEIEKKKSKSLIIKFFEQFKDFMIVVLIISAIVSGIVGVINNEGIADSIIIMIVIVVNAIIGVAQERKAEKSLESLKNLSTYVSKIIRDGKLLVVPSSELVVGDIVLVEAGDYVPADLRICEAYNLKAQEAALTGESEAVYKDEKTIIDKDVSLGDKKNLLFSSSLITYGKGKGIVIATGMNTEVGKIAKMMEDTKERQTPLQIKLNKLGKSLGIVALVICFVIFCIGLIYGKNALDMFMTAVTLAVAAIPEGLPAVSTIVLAIGVQKMVKKHAIIKNLPSVETLGSASVICTDKTGTLTQNKMTATKIFVNKKILTMDNVDVEDSATKWTLEIGLLCNDAKITEKREYTGDPTETALLDLGFRYGYNEEILNNERAAEIPFDSERKLMTTVYESDGKYIVYTKGGVDELLNICNSYELNNEIKYDLEEYKKVILKSNETMANDALRVIAMGYKVIETLQDDTNLEENLCFVGMVGMIDPPREEVKGAVQKCIKAGIKPVMITGDHKITAIAIAKELGLLVNDDEAITGAELEKMSEEELTKNITKYSVYARVSPEHKLRIVKAWQDRGHIVAMTGDGVNDAPALKNADIGCAMGITGTDVAKEVSDLIITDDNFATIVSAVEEGRRIYDNILKAIQFLLSSNIGEIVGLFLATLLIPILANKFGVTDLSNLELLLPIHILWINLVSDSLPALALAVDPAEKDVMKRKPKKKQTFLTKDLIYTIAYQGLTIGVLTLLAFILGLATPNVSDDIKIQIGQTMAFIVLGFSELVHIFNIRNNNLSIFKTGIGGNKYLFLAILASSVLMLAVLLIPGLQNIFNFAILSNINIIEVIVLSLMPIVIVEIVKAVNLKTGKGEKV